MCRRRRRQQLVKQAARVRARNRSYRVDVNLVVRRAREECLGLWVVVRLVTDDGHGPAQEVSRA
jgi:hypothetical protein